MTRTRSPCGGEVGREVDHRGGLPDAALLVGTGNRLAHQAPGRRVLTSVNSTIGRPFSLSRGRCSPRCCRRRVALRDARRGRRSRRRRRVRLGVARGTVQAASDRRASTARDQAPPRPALAERRASTRFQVEHAHEGRRPGADRDPKQAGANPTSCVRAGPARRRHPRADGACPRASRPSRKWPVSPIGAASVYSCTT